MGILKKLFGDYSQKEIKRIIPLQERVLSFEEEYKGLSDAELRAKTDEFKKRLSEGETLDDILPEAFATCREASARVLSMRHFPCQILGGIILHQGRISEMRTGEGKTLVATLPAYLNALLGKGVHIVTVNDYLARRDSEWMGKVYRFLGLSVGLVVPGMTLPQKQEAYKADITYCTNNELGFDYLRDNMAIYKENRAQRPPYFAIVDEVDSILIDEARTPLIISGQGEESSELYERADRLARKMKAFRVRQLDNHMTDEEQKIDGDYIVDEKGKHVSLTEAGVKKAEEFFGIENLSDPENLEISHHVMQAVRAYGVMKRDTDYVVKDGEIIIVDEFTGRLMFGRRYSEGLHQAIEAKEGVAVAHETRTLATITFQNLFRLYEKLSGMTGTARTEEAEFGEIYGLDVIEIPTNKEVIRVDEPDVIFKTERGKNEAVLRLIAERHAAGQPVLVGTITIENSEKLSDMLKKRGIKHNVLNAKNHEREAEIIAQAGKLGAVTIATNMAGRGTDIMLGGNAEYLAKAELKKQGMSDELVSEATGFAETDNEDILSARRLYTEYYEKYKAEIAPEAEKVRALGGLFIIGTERHESRRIDNQLRGRAGRQGDPGRTRFFVSFEDDLLRLRGGERAINLLNVAKVADDEPIELKFASSALETAQQAIEGQHFAARKSVLEFDNVMNQQREIIYKQRNRVLDGDDIHETVIKMIEDTIDTAVDFYCPDNLTTDGWNLAGLREHFQGWLCGREDFTFTAEKLNDLTKDELLYILKARAKLGYTRQEHNFGDLAMKEIERESLLRAVDSCWMEHIDAMHELKQGIALRAYGQHDPVVAYRNEGYEMFESMTENIRLQTTKNILTFRPLETGGEIKRKQVAKELSTGEKGKTVRGSGVVSKNALCPCGSGKKYKRCCGKGID